MARIELPKDQWAEMRDSLDEAPHRLAEVVSQANVKMAGLPMFTAAFQALQESDGDVSIQDALKGKMSGDDIALMLPLLTTLADAKILALVSAWSFDLPINAESLGEMPEGTYKVLAAEADKRGKDDDDDTAAALVDPTPLPADTNG
jgi:hypothetical protein